MLLAIDIGNTSTTIGVFNSDSLKESWRTETKKKTTADEYALLFKDFFRLAGFDFSEIDGVVISNVVPSVQHAVTSMSRRYFDVEPINVSIENVEIDVNYPNPAEIGADRLVNAIAAYDKTRSATIVVDFGTATTFDYIDEKGCYSGGAIAPGIAISNEALYHWTSKLPRVDIVKPDRVVGDSTVAAIQSGVYNGYVGLVKNIIEEIQREVKQDIKVVATGGLASLVVSEMGIEVDKFLTLKGLKLIYDRNR